MIEVRDVSKEYNGTPVLNHVNMKIEEGEFIAVMGASGSGKTTLLNCLSTIDEPSEGEVFYDGRPLSKLDEDDLATIRGSYLGFVFQDYNLLDRLNVFDNIALALTLSGTKYLEIKKQVEEISQDLSIGHILQKYPYDLSGGERQRVAFARAFITQPKLLIADEPTGSLDSESGKKIMELMQDLNVKYNTSILLVTHDEYSASYSNRILFIKDGRVTSEIVRDKNKGQEAFYKDILALSSFKLEMIR